MNEASIKNLRACAFFACAISAATVLLDSRSAKAIRIYLQLPSSKTESTH
jgi:hypothetical protein